MAQLNISLPPLKDGPDFDSWMSQVTEYLRDYLGYPTFIDRGDPSAYDLALVSMTTDGAYHDFDLSAIVPASAIAVLLRVSMADDAVGSTLWIRKKGNSNDYNAAAFLTQVAGVYQNFHSIVYVGTNRVIEYKATSTTWTAISILVAGWWI